MRITLDLPDAMLRQLKTKAVLEGTSLDDLLRRLVERGLQAPNETAPTRPKTTTKLPTIKLGRPLRLRRPSNAALFERLDE